MAKQVEKVPEIYLRVEELLRLYSLSSASAAHLLCDQHDPERVAYTVVSLDGSSADLTYGELRRDSERLASAFVCLGVRPGDRIATLMGKSRSYLITLMAIWRVGAVHVPLFTAFAPPAIALRLNASGCRLVVCDSAQRPKLRPSDVIPVAPPWRVVVVGNGESGDIDYRALMDSGQPGMAAAALGGDAPVIEIYTSGTTGTPKGVSVPLRAVAGFQVYAEYALGVRSDDIFWNAADPGWAYGLYFGILSSLTTSVHSILLEGGFSAETTLAVLERLGVTNFTAAPTVYRALRSSGLRPSAPLRLRCASSAGEPLTPEVNDWAQDVLGVQVYDHYGQTEAGMLVNNHHHPALERPLKSGSMGQMMPGWKAVILKANADELASAGESGRVAIDLRESPLAWFTGYLKDSTKTAEKFSADGLWYLTGDLGRVDEDGYFFFSSRADDVIIMAGYRISPAEVESAILTHPAVMECAVVAVADEVRGEVLEAVVVLHPGHQPGEALTAELQAWVKQKFAAHAYPRRVHYAESLPKTPSGKLQRFKVREQLRQDMMNSAPVRNS